MMESPENPLGLRGIQFAEFTSPTPEKLEDLFFAFGFSKIARHQSLDCELFQQNQIRFLLNKQKNTFSHEFEKLHGPSLSSMGWLFDSPQNAYEQALKAGAKPARKQDFQIRGYENLPAIEGIGGSLIYFLKNDRRGLGLADIGFDPLENPILRENKGFLAIDHLTNNVEKGKLGEWSDFYKDIFGFTEVRYFDIRGAKTGLKSYALQSPCQSFCIPINEGTEDASQINEYLREYKGSGVQHIAFTTEDIISSVQGIQTSKIETLDIDDEYYRSVFNRVPNVIENKQKLKDLNILVDGDESGYLLQIFTKNLIGPIFIEIIQRKNHNSFGEGNFGALFRSIERDQQKRGTLA